MKKIICTILIALSFSWTSNVSADKGPSNKSPESIVTCQTFGPGTYRVAALSLPASINAETCLQSIDDIALPCASCITSLEDQGCKVVDDVVTGKSNEVPNVTYFLSCVKP